MEQNTKDFKKFLDPKIISGLYSLDIKTKFIVEGFLLGLHRSPYHGFSIEFSQHRPYMQGDALKDVDWKVFAKTDKYFVKQYEEETNLRCHILLDTSKSMTFKGSSEISKLEYGSYLAASLSYLLIKQNDAAGLVLYSDVIEKFLPPKASNNYLAEIIKTLSNIQSSGKTNTPGCLNAVTEKINRRGLVIIISDFFDDLDSILNAVKKFRFSHNEVILFQILDPLERDFAFKNDSVFIDLETGEEITTQPYQIQRAYREAFQEFQAKLKKNCVNSGIDYNLIDTSKSLDTALLTFLQKRSKLG
ncbi:MAG: DUF58 domain-containing protein [Ignavibacteriaceae bacterium]|nr:DUF58 domain-containing protein [Ignavibacteriaceae bacterium]